MPPASRLPGCRQAHNGRDAVRLIRAAGVRVVIVVLAVTGTGDYWDCLSRGNAGTRTVLAVAVTVLTLTGLVVARAVVAP